MLAGGQTPLEAYRLVAERRPQAGKGLHVLFSDERHVPADSMESNYGKARPLLAALGLPEDRVLRVHAELGLAEAAQRWDDDLTGFFQRGGTIPFGVLGLGADGHTASLFSREDVERGMGCYAIPVTPPTGPARISVTPRLLKKVGHLVFVVTGSGKTEVVERLLHQPDSLTAGLAVAGAPSVDLYYAP